MLASKPYTIAYYTSWCNYPPRNCAPWLLPVEKLTHINYAFAKIVNNEIACCDPWADHDIEYSVPMLDGTTKMFKGNFGVLNDPQSPLRLRNPHLKTLISVGGWTLSKEFSTMAMFPEGRNRFIQSVLRFIETHRFDGVDIDWEYPVEGGMDDNARNPADGRNFGLLLRELREALRARSVPALLTLATSATPSIYRHLDFHAIREACDWVNIMTYDAAGAWSEKTGHHAPLYPFAHTVIQDYITRGLPPSQVCLGVPFYGRGFAGVAQVAPGSAYASVPMGTHEAGIFDYAALVRDMAGYTTHMTAETGPVLYAAARDGGVWIGYDDAASVAAKARYVRAGGLRGVFFWEASMDTHDAALVSAIQRGYMEG